MIVEGGYIRVVQDVRGKYGSEGDYVMNRPLHGPQNPTPVDNATDTYDTIDWLVANVPESNGRVGILGISYDGFLPLMALVHPHPALKVAVPMNPMVDGWRGDDWFHNGAFRQLMMPYVYEQEATRKSDEKWWRDHFDDYDTFLEAGSAAELGRRHGMEQLGFWRKILAHPAYDAFWRDQAVDRILADEPLDVPVMLVASLWDQEDIYGAVAVYRAIEPKDTGNDRVYLVLGPWYHGQEIKDASALGPLRWGSDTGLWFRRNVLRPFLDHYLKDGAPAMDVAPVTAFESGTNRWERLDAWPSGCPEGCTIEPTPLYLEPGGKVGFAPPAASADPAGAAYTEYLSDPAKPVPFIHRPIPPRSFDAGQSWHEWLVSDQREVSGRPDVVTFVSDVLAEPVSIAGQPRGPPRGLDQRHRLRLGGEADRPLPGRGGGPAGDGRLPAHGRGGRLPRPLPREPRDTRADRRRRAAAVRVRAADGEPRLPARPPDRGAGPVELVPALRPQPADLRPEHLRGEARRLPEGHAAHLPRPRRGELRRAAGRPAIDEIGSAGSRSPIPKTTQEVPRCAGPLRPAGLSTWWPPSP